MQYTNADLEQLMGVKLDPLAQIVVETQRGAILKQRDPNWKRMGEVPDFTARADGMMVVLSLRPPEPPKPKPKPVPVVVAKPTPKPVAKVVAKPKVETTVIEKKKPRTFSPFKKKGKS